MFEIGPREELDRLFNSPANRKIKHIALVVISITLVLLLAGLIWIDQLSDRSLLLLRGFAGLFAIVFAILYTVLVYRVYREYIHKKG